MIRYDLGMYDWDICILHLKNKKNICGIFFLDGSVSHDLIVWKGRCVSESLTALE